MKNIRLLLRHSTSSLHRVIFSPQFIICVFAIFALCLTANIGNGGQSDKPMSVYQLILHRYETINNINFCSYAVFSSFGTSWSALFFPIIAAFPYITVQTGNVSDNCTRFTIHRVGKQYYHLGNVCCAIISGGCVSICGYILFGIVVWLLFPSIYSYSPELLTQFLSLRLMGYPNLLVEAAKQGNIYILVIIDLVIAFFMNGICVLPAVTLSAFVRNRYIILCTPFFLSYSWTQINSRLTAFAYSDRNKINESLAHAMTLTHPQAIRYILFSNSDALFILIVHFGWALLLSFCYFIVINRRLDSGENA